MLPKVHFSKSEKVDWRKTNDPKEDWDEDEELEKTPEDVIEMLGFDPKEPED